MEVLNLCCFTHAIPDIVSYVYTVDHLGAILAAGFKSKLWSPIFLEPDLNAYHITPTILPLLTQHTLFLKCGK